MVASAEGPGRHLLRTRLAPEKLHSPSSPARAWISALAWLSARTPPNDTHTTFSSHDALNTHHLRGSRFDDDTRLWNGSPLHRYSQPSRLALRTTIPATLTARAFHSITYATGGSHRWRAALTSQTARTSQSIPNCSNSSRPLVDAHC
jgi:hypothetical protein